MKTEDYVLDAMSTDGQQFYVSESLSGETAQLFALDVHNRQERQDIAIKLNSGEQFVPDGVIVEPWNERTPEEPSQSWKGYKVKLMSIDRILFDNVPRPDIVYVTGRSGLWAFSGIENVITQGVDLPEGEGFMTEFFAYHLKERKNSSQYDVRP